MSMSSPVMTTSWQGALPLIIRGAIGLSRPSRTFCRIVFSSDWNASSALLRSESRCRPDQPESRCRCCLKETPAGRLIGLFQRLADIGECRNRPVDVDQLALLAQHVEELAKILVWHCGLRQSMIPKSGNRFSDKIMLQQKIIRPELPRGVNRLDSVGCCSVQLRRNANLGSRPRCDWRWRSQAVASASVAPLRRRRTGPTGRSA